MTRLRYAFRRSLPLGAWAKLTLGAVVVFAGAAAAATAVGANVEVTAFSQGFETGFGNFTVTCPAQQCQTWSRTDDLAYSGSYSIFDPDLPFPSVTGLFLETSIAIPANATEAKLTFRQQFDFEQNQTFRYDGGVLELWSDSSGTWTDAGPSFVAGGYNGSIVTGGSNPLSGRAAWVGSSGGWQEVRVDLTAFRGDGVRFRLLLGTDVSNNTPVAGWWADDFTVTYRAPLEACERRWSFMRSYPTGASNLSFAGVGDALYAFGGYDGENVLAQAFRYSVEEDAWSPIATLPSPRYDATTVTDGTYVYIIGGVQAAGEAPQTNLWRYDPAKNNYVTLESSGVATSLAGAAYLDGFIYRVAGDPGNAIGTIAVERYSIADGVWESTIDYPAELAGVAAAAFEGHLFAVGGFGFRSPSVSSYRYDAVRHFWDDGPIADLPLPGGFAWGTVYRGNWIVGVIGDAPSTVLFSWDPKTNLWRSLDSPPLDMRSLLLATAGSSAYALGQTRDDPGATQLLRYTESSCSPCVGDCGDDRIVSVVDLVRGVRIARHLDGLASCSAFDADHDGEVDAEELRQAIENDLRGCSAGG